MPYVRVKQKYQVTIPASVRETLGLHEGDTLEAKVEDGHIVLIPQQMMAREAEREAGRPNADVSLAKYVGAAKGLYKSPEEVDEHIRNLRDEWAE